jgi:hypothetical protein
LYIKPNISLNFKYLKISLESHIFFEDSDLPATPHKSPEVSFTVSLRDWGAAAPFVVSTVVVLAAGIIVTSPTTYGADYQADYSDDLDLDLGLDFDEPSIESNGPYWGDLNLESWVY